MNFIEVSAGTFRIGTTIDGLRDCVEKWRSRLIEPCYSEEAFREWIAKEFPAHAVESKGFEMSQTLVSNQDVKNFLRQTFFEIPESLRVGEPDNHPVWGVSQKWAKQFADWLSQSDSEYRYRLPTEAEWEVAARGGDFREYPYGHEFNRFAANTIESERGMTSAIDAYSRSPGPFGHYDLSGNVEEWVSTNYTIYPGGRLIHDDLYWQFGMNYPILRGGSFACGGDLSRAARRHGPFPNPRFRFTGFRLIRERKA